MLLLALQQRDAGTQPLLPGDNRVHRRRSNLLCHRDSSVPAGGSADSVRTSPFPACLPRSFHTTDVASPPADPAPATIRAQFVRHAGHIAWPPPAGAPEVPAVTGMASEGRGISTAMRPGRSAALGQEEAADRW